ncbi:MAG: hypothetical protein IJ462_02165 [Clostridia bacterium]|nr:hypothetical protein [Clostridia bacterium]
MSQRKRFYSIISHTHWDREWYISFEQFRIRLVSLMNNLLDILDNDEEYRFHLDAQTIVLDDYLEIHPENRQKIIDYIKDGRLLIGPWYVQNDFHLTSGEATVRNLIIGIKSAENYGKCTKVGYAADQFGLCSQLPQILNGFDIDTCIFGRGYARHDTQFYWRSQNGSRVLCEHMFQWYNNLQRLPDNAKNSLSFIRQKGNDCGERTSSSSVLLMNGVDHLEAQENLTKIIHDVRPLLDQNETLCQDTMPEYMQRLKEEIKELGLVLQEFEGEFRDLGSNNVLSGTLSSRIHLKKTNARIQSEIERGFEPNYAELCMLGLAKYPLGYSNYLWKTLIQNHPHDSICGCSIEAVHNHMMDRFIRIDENLDSLNYNANENYLMHVDRTGIDQNAVFVMCVNNSVYAYNGIFEADIEMLQNEDIGGFTLKDKNGKNIPFEVIDIKKNVSRRILSPINLPGEAVVTRYKIAFNPGKVKGLSRKVLIATPAANSLAVTENTKKYSYQMENEFLKVKINKNGTVDLTEKASNKTFSGILYFKDFADRGNVYIYEHGTKEEEFDSLSQKVTVTLLKETKLIKSRLIKTKIKVDRDMAKGEIPIEMKLTLKAGSKHLDVEIKVDNILENHRLRIMLPTDIAGDINYSGQPFDVIVRNKVSKYPSDENHPNTDFVGIDGDGYGIALLNEGLYEYEHMTDNRNTLALTILRSIGRITDSWENRNSLAKVWQVPDGQMKGEHICRLSVYPYKGDHTAANVVNEAASFLTAPYTFTQHINYNKFIGGRPFVQSTDIPLLFYRDLENADIIVPLEKTFVTMEQNVENAMMLSAFKGAENSDGVILRLYNTTEKEVDFTLKFGFTIKKAFITNMNEDEKYGLGISRGRNISLTAKPKEIVTLKVIL